MLRSPPEGFFDSDVEEDNNMHVEAFCREGQFILQESIPISMPTSVGIEALLGNLSLNQISSAKPAAQGHNHNHFHHEERADFYFEQDSKYNLITDPSSNPSKPILLYASPMKLIEHMTTTLDYKLMDDFLLCLEAFVDVLWFAQCLVSLLKKVFKVSGSNWLVSADMAEVMKMRCLVILQHWHSNVAASFNEALPKEVIQTVLNGLDDIWTQARMISDADRRLIAKIRRLYDPSCEHSQYSTTTASEVDEIRVNFSDADSDYYESAASSLKRRKWSVRIKEKLKRLFSRSGSQGQLQLSPASSLLITSFSSDIEDRENEACQILIGDRSRNLALILAAVEADLFSAIERSEVVLFPQVRDCPMKLAANCPNLQRSIDHFNSMCRWFAYVLSTQNDPQTAADLLAKLIRLAVKCMLGNNFNSFLQIVLALQTPAVANLTEVWDLLPTWEQRLARDLTAFGSPARNFKNIRRAMEEVFDGEEVDSPGGTPVPFTGLFLSDSIFNWEHQDEQLQSFPKHVAKPLPVYKCHVAAKVIRQFRQYKQVAMKTAIKLDDKQRQLYSFFADIGRLGGDFLESY